MIEVLEEKKAEYGDVFVKGTYEGVVRHIRKDNIYASKFHAILIDLEFNHYEEDFSIEPKTNEEE